MRKTLAVRTAAVLLTGVTAVIVLAACGGSSKNVANSPTSGPNSSTTRPNASAIQAYVACLGQHGVTLNLPTGRPSFTRSPRPSGAPRPTGSGGGFGGGGFGGGGFGGGGFGGIFGDPNNPPAGVDAATWSAALTACKSLQPTFGGRGTGGGFNNSAFTAYRNCLRSHGVTLSAGPQGLSTSDPKVAAALKACAPLRPTGRPTAAPSPTG